MVLLWRMRGDRQDQQDWPVQSETITPDPLLCRDTFARVKKTCNKQGTAFWGYPLDRTSPENSIPYVPDLLSETATIRQCVHGVFEKLPIFGLPLPDYQDMKA